MCKMAAFGAEQSGALGGDKGIDASDVCIDEAERRRFQNVLEKKSSKALKNDRMQAILMQIAYLPFGLFSCLTYATVLAAFFCHAGKANERK